MTNDPDARPLTDYEREAVAAKLISDLRLPEDPAITDAPVAGRYVKAGCYAVTELGGLTPAFGTVTVEVFITRLGVTPYLTYEYRWAHADQGRNGYTVRGIPVPLPMTASKAALLIATATAEADARGTLSDDERLSLTALYDLLERPNGDKPAKRVLNLMPQGERELIPHAVRVFLCDDTAPAEPDAE